MAGTETDRQREGYRAVDGALRRFQTGALAAEQVESAESFHTCTLYLTGMNEDTEDEQDEDLPEPLEDERGESSTSSVSQGAFSRMVESLRATSLANHEKRMERIAENLMYPIYSQLDELAETMRKYQEEVRRVVESTIELDEPWEYDPDESMVQERAEKVVRRQLLHLIEELMDVDDPYLQTIQYRTRIGYEAYTGSVRDENGERVDIKPRPHEAIFLFISLQDGLMHWLCEQDETVEPDRCHGEGDERRYEYRWSTKRETLKDAFVSSHGLASDSAFESNLDAFYHHRNFVMHSNRGAVFDMNIATASALFFVLTLYTVLDELERMEEQ